MKLNRSILLSALVQSLFTRSFGNRTGLKINQQESKSKRRRKLTNIDCLLLIKSIEYQRERVSGTEKDESLDCLLDGEDFPIPIVGMPSWLEDKLYNDELNSNNDILGMSEAFISNEGIYIPANGQTSIRRKEESRHLAVKRKRSVIAMRVSVTGQAPPSSSSTSELSNSIFGTSGDEFNLVSAFAQCSYDKLKFLPGTDYYDPDLIDGVMDVELGPITNNHEDIYKAALASKGWNFTFKKPPYDHVS